MNAQDLAPLLGTCVETLSLPPAVKLTRGKVRDVVDLGSEVLLTTTDRISAFDRVLTTVPCKGEVLNTISNFWFRAAAIIILAAPKERRIGLPNSHYLIHQPMSGTRGVATEIEIHAKEIEKLRAKINRLIADETGQALEKVQKDTDRDYWMNAEEAVAYGLVARVIKTRDEL